MKNLGDGDAGQIGDMSRKTGQITGEKIMSVLRSALPEQLAPDQAGIMETLAEKNPVLEQAQAVVLRRNAD